MSNNQIIKTIISKTKLAHKQNHQSTSNQLTIQKLQQQLNSLLHQHTYELGQTSKFLRSIKSPQLQEQEQSQGQYFQIQEIKIQINNQASFHKLKSTKTQTQYTYLQIQQNLYIFNNCFIPHNINHSNLSITYVLSLIQPSAILSYVQLCLQTNCIVNAIIPECFRQGFTQIMKFLFEISVLQILPLKITYLKEQKVIMFDFENSTLLFSRNLFHIHSFNVFICINGLKYAIIAKHINNQEIAYKGWKIGLYNQEEYCRIIDKKLLEGIVWSSTDKQNNSCKIETKCQCFRDQKVKLFDNFKKCEIFFELPDNIIQEIFFQGKIDSMICDQTLHKAYTKLQKFYIVLQGQIEILNEQNNIKNILQKCCHFDINSLFQQQIKDKTTLKIHSQKAFIFSIEIQKIKYLLSHFLTKIQNLHQHIIEPSFLHNIIGLTEWERKILAIDTLHNANFSSKVTKPLINSKTKISLQNWLKISVKNLNFILATQKNN